MQKVTPEDERKHDRSKLALGLVPILILLTPFLAFLQYHRYGYFRLETIVIGLAIVTVGALCGLLINRAHKAVGAALLAACLTVFVDLQFDAAGYLLLTLGASAILAWILRDHIGEILLASFATILLSTVLIPTQQAPGDTYVENSDFSPAADGPTVVHVLLDEHVGVEGIPHELDPQGELKAKVKDFYLGRGFRLFGNAYSRYFATYNTVPNLFNFTAMEVDAAHMDGRWDFSNALTRNDYFLRMREQGYRIRVYQSSFIDYCNTAGVEVFSCRTYPANSIHSLRSTALGSWAKTSFMLNYYANESKIYTNARRAYRDWMRPGLESLGLSLPRWDWEGNKMGPVPVLPVIEELRRDIADSPRGTFFFAHLLIPHFPYLLDESCRLRDAPADRLGLRRSLEKQGLEGWKRRYQLYLDQLKCSQSQLAGILDALETAGHEDAIVIVHGDHGSRLTKRDTLLRERPPLNEEDFRAAHSTLFALRAPGIRVEYDEGLLAIDEILKEHLEEGESAFASRKDTKPYILRMRKEGILMEKEWIDFPKQSVGLSPRAAKGKSALGDPRSKGGPPALK